jgi:hypothetical protein
VEICANGCGRQTSKTRWRKCVKRALSDSSQDASCEIREHTLWQCQEGKMGEWKMWNRATLAHWKLLLSGIGSIVLGFAQYFSVGFVQNNQHLRSVLLVLFPSVAIGCFYFASFFTWRDNYRELETREPLASAFCKSLKRRCDELITGWADLDRQFLEAAKTDQEPKTLQGPLDPGWKSSTFFYWPSQICAYQKLYNGLREDLHSIRIPLDSYDSLTTMPQLQTILNHHREQIAKI